MLLRQRLGEHSGAGIATRLRGIPGAWWGMWLAHLGIGVFIIGVTLVKSLEQSADVPLKYGQTTQLAGYDFTLKGVYESRGPNFTAARGEVLLARKGVTLNTLNPEKRIYTARQMPMTEASIDNGVLRDVYVSLGEATAEDTWIVRLYYKPFVSWIWLGCLLMAIGGVCAAMDARYRRMAARTAAVPAGTQEA